jgi:hypothetical protein
MIVTLRVLINPTCNRQRLHTSRQDYTAGSQTEVAYCLTNFNPPALPSSQQLLASRLLSHQGCAAPYIQADQHT